MSLPASNGPIAPHRASYLPTPLPPQIPGLPNYDVSRPNPWDAHFNNHQLGHPGLPDDADDFLLSAFDVPQSSAQGANPSHSIPITNQPPSDVWPSANPTPPDGPSQYISTNPTFQAAYTRPSSVADRPFTGSGELALAAHWQDAAAAAAPAPLSYPRRGRTAPHANPAALGSAPMQYPGVGGIDAGAVGLAHQPAADTRTSTRYTRTGSTRRVQVRPARDRGRRGAREVPFVRVDDRVEWVRRDVLKMTLFFNFSLDAEGEAHEAWGEAPRVRVASAPFSGGGAVPAESASAPPLRSSEWL